MIHVTHPPAGSAVPDRIQAALRWWPASGGRARSVAVRPWRDAVAELTGRAIVGVAIVLLVSNAGSDVVATALAGLIAVAAAGFGWAR